MHLCSLLFIFGVFCSCADSSFLSGASYCVNNVNKAWSIQPCTNHTNGIAVGSFLDRLNATGWVELTVQTNASYTDAAQAYAAGLLEGALTAGYIWNSFLSFNETLGFPNNTWFDPRLIAFVTKQDKFVRAQADTQKTSYWNHIRLVLAQFDGIMAGYGQYAGPSRRLTYTDWLFLQLQSEWQDIQSSWQWVQPQPVGKKNPAPANTHCSVLVRQSNDKMNLFSSHVTWTSFVFMLRVYKTYNFPFRAAETSAQSISFSSFPGVLCSSDDYYTTFPSMLTVMETTNDVMNQTLFQKYISTQTVPFWMRIMVANRMATGGSSWFQVFAQFNSGTYNNQYQIVDYKLFKPNQPLPPNLLWIVEQVPGFVVGEDKTDVLKAQGFWPSYNIPYFKFIYDISNYTIYYQLYGNAYSYSKCPRAQIFGRDAPKVNTWEQFKAIMRYNNYQNDPLSLQDACNAISCRADLNVPWDGNSDFGAFGAIDCKATSQVLVKEQMSLAVCGPTWDQQPPFAWTNQWPFSQFPWYGQPKVFAFDFVLMKPSQFV